MSSLQATNRLKQISQILDPELSSTGILPLTKFSLEARPDHPYKICVLGGGSWGTTITKIIAENCLARPRLFRHHVQMYVYEEKINGENLTDIINTRRENVKYLPGVKLPRNIVANPDILKTVEGADLIVFNFPHQHLTSILKQLKGHVPHTTRGISCLKGLEVNKDGCKLLSSHISDELGIVCGALSGANLAPEIAKEKWSETTIAYKLPEDYRGPGKDIDEVILKAVFHRPYFHVNIIQDVAGVSVAGALKNVVALAVGFVEGLGWGDNAKSAIMRVGLLEIVKFSETFFPESVSETFTKESAGVADLITTCLGGRNVKVGKYMAETGADAHEAERALLNGQSSQGIVTITEVHELLSNVGKLHEYPLFAATYKITFGSESIENLPNLLSKV
ncbi:Glycerol-3-phosphate dehydrogenase NAD [Spathaspora sp. JA1]|nr:Glycerol-3-phosphate dehydrogenase NAD [Spathaspora sp. JA1]